MNILITSVGGTLIPLLTKFLKQDDQLLGLYIVGIDKNNKIKKNKYLDKFYSIKSNNDSTYLKKIIKICEKEKVQLVIPWSDKEAVLMSKYKKKFVKKKIKVFVNDFNVIKKVTNKFSTYNILKKAKIRTPSYMLVRNVDELKKGLAKFNYPKKGVILKPISNSGGRGVKILQGLYQKTKKWIGHGKREEIVRKNKLSLSNNLFKDGKLLMMNILKSPAFDVDYFCYKNEQSGQNAIISCASKR